MTISEMQTTSASVFGNSTVNVSMDMKSFTKSFSDVIASKITELQAMTESGELSEADIIEMQLELNDLQQAILFGINIESTMMSLEKEVRGMM